ncbi:hypothetical protein GCM10028803_02520 [Larkinella knui]
MNGGTPEGWSVNRKNATNPTFNSRDKKPDFHVATTLLSRIAVYFIYNEYAKTKGSFTQTGC